MAAGSVLPMPIAGLHRIFTPSELNKTTVDYNSLPPDDDNLPLIPDKVRDDIQALIKEFGVDRKFCFHLLHNHAELEPGTVMLGQKLSDPKLDGAIWSRPTLIEGLDLNNIRGHIFVYDTATGNFGPYELREGPPAPMSDNDNKFVAAFMDYLTRNNLTKALGLEILPDQKMVELIFNNNFGTVLVRPEHCKLASPR